jgi:hypothetical protein
MRDFEFTGNYILALTKAQIGTLVLFRTVSLSANASISPELAQLARLNRCDMAK